MNGLTRFDITLLAVGAASKENEEDHGWSHAACDRSVARAPPHEEEHDEPEREAAECHIGGIVRDEQVLKEIGALCAEAIVVPRAGDDLVADAATAEAPIGVHACCVPLGA